MIHWADICGHLSPTVVLKLLVFIIQLKVATAVREYCIHERGEPCLAGMCESNTWFAGPKLFQQNTLPLPASLVPIVYPGCSISGGPHDVKVNIRSSDQATFLLWYSFDAHVPTFGNFSGRHGKKL